jgi:hypothetical protein
VASSETFIQAKVVIQGVDPVISLTYWGFNACLSHERASGLSEGLGYAQERFGKSDLCRRTLMILLENGRIEPMLTVSRASV